MAPARINADRAARRFIPLKPSELELTSSNASITLAVGTNPGGTLACNTNPLTATGGVASFGGCEITGKLGSYTLTAAATGLTGTTSNAFSITIGAASQLAFTTQPGGGVDGTAWTNQPVVTVQDPGGNTVSSNASITLAIATQPGSGASLACTTNPLGATGGTASFAGCRITGETGSYTLSASATGLTAVTSTPFNITIGGATQLGFTTQPGGGANGSVWSTQPAVSLEDVGGNPLSTGTNSITLAVGTQPGSGATLACTTNPLNAGGGTASFGGCKITGKAGSYTLTAAATGLTGTTSNAFSITPGTATQLVFTTQPGGSVTEGTPFAQPVVTAEDASGNAVTSYSTGITLGVKTYTAGNGGSASGAVSGCTNPMTPSNGVATFSGCAITGTAGAGTYTLSATSGSFSATSTNITIVAGTASQLVFTTQPGGSVTEGTAFTQPVVTAEDASGNTVTTFASRTTLSIQNYTTGNGGSAQGNLACNTNPVTATGGIASFGGCNISGAAAAGTYNLQAAGGGLTSAASATVTVVAGNATQVQFTTQPTTANNSNSGTVFTTQPVVSVEDTNGNVVTNATNQVTLGIGSGTGGTLHCTTNPLNAVAGEAAFAGCNITHSGGRGTWTLTAAATSLAGATSNTFRT